jgi:molybdenum cofactor cytidylyltransferase
MRVGAVVLAAGKSLRMGRNKLLLPLKDKTVIENILDSLEAASVREQIVVLGTEPQEVVETIKPRLSKVKIALNLSPELGMASSFKTGLIMINNVDAAFLVLGDQAILDPNLLTKMVKTMEDNPEELIVSPIHNGKKGHPLLFHRKLFGEILSLKDTQTLREVIHGHEDRLVTVEAPEWTIIDIDTPEDYERLINLIKTGQFSKATVSVLSE